MILETRSRSVLFPRRPLVMGIINLNDDSLSHDGTLDVDRALRHARTLVEQGADLIDVGGESARTNRPPIAEGEEIRRVFPFVERFREVHGGMAPVDAEQLFPPLLSLNTWRPAVGHAVLPIGCDLLNDLGALPTDDNARLAAAHGVALLIMHSVGLPKQPHTDVHYADVMHTLEDFFEVKIAQATAAGLRREAIVLDPGIDFAKQKKDNLRILRELDSLRRFERPILMPVSRKTVIGEVLGKSDARERDAGTVACVVAGMLRGASIFRVHNVHAVSQAVRVIWRTIEGTETDAGGSR
ncbi:MAG TPA: dihydropteroate synthase [Chthoniobacterales bacterium]